MIGIFTISSTVPSFWMLFSTSQKTHQNKFLNRIRDPKHAACRLKWFHLRLFSHFPGMICRICLFTKFIHHIIRFFLLPKNGEVSGEMTKPNSLGLHWPSRDRPDPCWTGTMSQPKMHPPLSVRLIYGFCKKNN